MRRLIASNKLQLVDSISLGDELESCNSASIEQTDQINCLLLLETFFIAKIIKVELQFASVDGCTRACPVYRSEGIDILLPIFIVSRTWNINDLDQLILRELPHFAYVRACTD